MAVEFSHSDVMKMFEKKRQKFLIKTGFQGVVLAAVNSKIDTGLSQGAKQFSFRQPGTGHQATVKNKETKEYFYYNLYLNGHIRFLVQPYSSYQ